MELSSRASRICNETAATSAPLGKEDRLIEAGPLFRLVEHQRRIDHAQRLAGEGTLHRPARREEAALLEDALALLADHEVVIEQRRVRVRRTAREREAVGARDRR